jgi:hypothetical protein
MLTTDIERFIDRKFKGLDREAAWALCKVATIHDGSPRLIRCALFICQASLEKLRDEIEHLKIDYRDVILAAEYVSRGGELLRVRNFNEPIENED